MSTLRDFEEFCGELTLDNGRRMVLEEFQKVILADYFAGIPETVALLPKKSGKSTLLGALALFHLLTTHEAECVIAAASRDQAMILYDQARGFVRRSPALGAHVEIRRGYRELRAIDGDGRIRVLAADSDTADGVLPTLALVDELHRHRSGELYAIFRDGLGPRDGRMVTISTAGDDESSPLGVLRSQAYAMPGMVRDGAHRYVRSASFAMHEWSLDAEDDRDDLELVKSANPASWTTIDALRSRHDSPSMTPWAWARFACGVWMYGQDAAISSREWRACAEQGVEIPGGASGVFIGCDLAFRHDTTAFAPVWRRADGVIVAHRPTIIEPPSDGTSTRIEDLWDALEEMDERWPQVTFVLDPNAGGEQLAQRLDVDLGARVATHSQKAPTMALAAQRLQEAIAGRKLRHPDDPGLNAHVLAATARPVGEAWRFVKPRKGSAPIDAVIALSMAISTLIGEDQQPEPGRIYQWS